MLLTKLQQSLMPFLEEIRTNKEITNYDEASTKNYIILRLLQILEWNPFNPQEVTPEYTVGQKRVDYSLRINSKNKIFLEVKRIGEDLENHQKQLLEYSFEEGIQLAVLTSGLEWWFYLPLENVNWLDRRFCKFNLMEGDTHEISDRLANILGKFKVENQDHLKYAKVLYKEKQQESVVEENLTKAWGHLVSKPDSRLISLINEVIVELGGFETDVDSIINFIKNNVDTRQPIKLSKVPKVEKKRMRAPASSSAAKISYTGKSVEGFAFKGVAYKAKIWKDLILTVAERIYEDNKSSFDRVLGLTGTKRVYYTKDPNQQREPRKVGDSDIYVETHFNANSIVKMTYDLMSLFGYSRDTLKIELRS